MMKLSAGNAVAYLQSRGYLAPNEPAIARELDGGVSNIVVRIDRPDDDDLVLKQARERLNVAEPWFCSVNRIWREVDVLRYSQAFVPDVGTDAQFKTEVPRLLFEDRENYVYAMTAAPVEHVVWKSELLSGRARPEVADACGRFLGGLHAGSWHDATIASDLDDRQFFDALRLDPYYRQVARVHTDLAPAIEQLIESVWSERHCLVHGDFSPKNLLLYGQHVMLIDFEVGHYGDPAFDLGFLLSHLTLKAFHFAPADKRFFDLIDSFWSGYRAEMERAIPAHELDMLIQRGIQNFAGCALSRLDGKSKIDYLNDDIRRNAVRALCREIFAAQPAEWNNVRMLAKELLAGGPSSNSAAAK